MQDALDANVMTAAERLAGLGEILAVGLLQLRAGERETLAGRPLEPAKGRPSRNRSRRARTAI